MKRKDSPHVIIFDKNLVNDNRFEILPEDFDIKRYQEEMVKTKGKPIHTIEYFSQSEIGKLVDKELGFEKEQSPVSAIPISRNSNDMDIGIASSDTAEPEAVSETEEESEQESVVHMKLEELRAHIANAYGVSVPHKKTRDELLRMERALRLGYEYKEKE